ncbi:hypothetical protein NMY22_g19724 [Coprinellus aureogranulatus]|nr:hypothetical protein NMY22_g19724 [Coprinellus aureogranulatus]
MGHRRPLAPPGECPCLITKVWPSAAAKDVPAFKSHGLSTFITRHSPASNTLRHQLSLSLPGDTQLSPPIRTIQNTFPESHASVRRWPAPLYHYPTTTAPRKPAASLNLASRLFSSLAASVPLLQPHFTSAFASRHDIYRIVISIISSAFALSPTFFSWMQFSPSTNVASFLFATVPVSPFPFHPSTHPSSTPFRGLWLHTLHIALPSSSSVTIDQLFLSHILYQFPPPSSYFVLPCSLA